MPKKATNNPARDLSLPVHCRDCVNASEFVENSCYCKAMGRRVCACMRYGRICWKYKKS